MGGQEPVAGGRDVGTGVGVTWPARLMVASEAEARALVEIPIAVTIVLEVKVRVQGPVVGPVLIVATVPVPGLPPDVVGTT